MKQYNKSIRGKLFNYFKQRVGLKQSTKGWWRANCVFCGGKQTMGVNLDNNKVHCFKCLEEKTPIETLMEIEGFETFNQVTAFIKVQQEYEYFETFAKTVVKREYVPVQLPESFRLISQGDDIYGRAARHYLTKKRKFNLNKLVLKGVGYCTKGEYDGYIIFPFYRKGQLQYYQGRLYLGDGPKMKNPREEDFNVGKTQLIYNVDSLFIYNKVYVMESITNCLTLGDNTAGLLGKTISPHQLNDILLSPCERVVLLLDPDAWAEALDLALQVVHYKMVKAVRLPDSKDVNDLGKTTTMEIVKKTPYHTYNELFKMKLNART